MTKSSEIIKQDIIESGISLSLNKDYKTLLNELKNKIRGARLKAALAINCEVIGLYWQIGKQIIERQNWGSKLVETLSNDLQNTFPETSGFSVRNLQRMRQFAAYYPNFEIVPQAVAQLPWGHISFLIHKVKDDTVRLWYAEQAIEIIKETIFNPWLPKEWYEQQHKKSLQLTLQLE